ncbi:hypothetical protein [Adonisia turfae]|nr:hypothetical protein [Adonisia turfae]
MSEIVLRERRKKRLVSPKSYNRNEENLMNYITQVNQKWGVCGFVSALLALYDHDEAFRNKLDAIHERGHYNTRVIADMSTYLVLLKSENEDLLTEIREFTNSFGNVYRTNNNQTLIERTQNYARLVGKQAPLEKLPAFGIAMPPQGVQEYLSRNYEINSNLVQEDRNIICGLKGVGKGLYNGLKHWVYINKKGQVFTWGQQYNNFQDFADQHRNLVQMIFRIQLATA